MRFCKQTDKTHKDIEGCTNHQCLKLQSDSGVEVKQTLQKRLGQIQEYACRGPIRVKGPVSEAQYDVQATQKCKSYLNEAKSSLAKWFVVGVGLDLQLSIDEFIRIEESTLWLFQP